MKRCARDRQRGASLIELVISIVVIGIAFAGILRVVQATTRHSADPVVLHQALAVAESYLEEILAADYTDPDGTDVGETRPTYDDIDDYAGLAGNGCSKVTPACPNLGDCPCAQDGSPVAALRGYRVSVNVTPDGLGPAGAGRIPAGTGDATRITVTVHHASGAAAALSAYRTRP